MGAELVESSSAKAVIRILPPGELYRIIPFAGDYVREQPRPGGFSMDMFLGFWQTVLTQFSGVILVAEIDGEIVGGTSGYLVPDCYTRRLLAQQGFFYIAPEHRDGQIWIEVFEAFLQWAKTTPAVAIRVGSLAGRFERPLYRLYVTHGFLPLEQHFEREV